MKLNPLESFSISKAGQRFYKWMCDPNKQSTLCRVLPTIETAVCTTSYCLATEKQKNIPRNQKNLLQWQNILGGVAGMIVGSWLNKKASKLVDEIAPKINKGIMDVHKVKMGLAIGLPLCATALVMRLFVPIATAQISAMAEEHRRKKANLNKLA